MAEEWTTERLNTLAALVSRSAENIDRNTENLDRNTENIGTLDRKLEVLIEVTARNSGEITELKGIVQNVSDNLALLIDERRLDRQEWKVMQSEIRGLQVENHRILERLEGHTSDGHGG